MFRTTFLQIWWYLHFAENNIPPSPDSDEYKIQLFLNLVIARFQEVYLPDRQLLLPTKHWSSLKGNYTSDNLSQSSQGDLE